MSLGLVGRKVGMTRVFTDEGDSVPVTVVDVSDNRVTQIKTAQTHTTCKMVQERHVSKVPYTVMKDVVETQVRKVPYTKPKHFFAKDTISNDGGV